jgi:hypothetical protein
MLMGRTMEGMDGRMDCRKGDNRGEGRSKNTVINKE